jgi:hypothetical protein
MVGHATTTKGNYVTIPVANPSQEVVVMKAFDAFVQAVRDIPTVEQVRAQPAGTYLHLVTYMSQSTEEQRFAVYTAELMVHDRFPELSLEFDLIDRDGYALPSGQLTGKLVEPIRALPDTKDVNQLY